MFGALIFRLRVRRLYGVLGLAVVLGVVTLPVAALPMPGNDHWSAYASGVLFNALPVPLAALTSFLARPVVIDGEDAAGSHAQAVRLSHAIGLPVVPLAGLVIPALAYPVSAALTVALSMAILVAAMALLTAAWLPWQVAWLPGAVVSFGQIYIRPPLDDMAAHARADRVLIIALAVWVIGVIVATVTKPAFRAGNDDE